MKALLGQKIGMTQIFGEDGHVVPVTVVQAGPCRIVQVKTVPRDGYNAIQLGFGEVRQKSLLKPQAGRFTRASVPPARWLREVRVENPNGFQVGQEYGASVFNPGEYVDVVGISKGKGFSGTVKRHNFGGGPATHGQSDRHRAPGSIGSNTFPGHVLKGLRMSGHLGAERITVQHLEVVKVDPEHNLLFIRGAVPGVPHHVLQIRQTVKRVKVRVVHKVEVAPKKVAKKEAPAAKAAEKPKAEKSTGGGK